MRSNGLPTTCEAGKPLDYSGLTYSKLVLGDAVTLPAGDTVSLATPLSASGGVLSPASPY